MDKEQMFKNYMQCVGCGNSFENKDPQILSCLHSMCSSCLEKVAKQESPVCPLCLESLDLNVTSIKYLPSDRRRKFLYELLKIKRSSSTDLLCYKCQNAAQVRCRECEKNLCENCIKDHNIFIKNHKVTTFDDLRNKAMTDLIVPLLCQQQGHPFLLTRYCHTDETAICELCEKTGHQEDKGHRVENIESAYDEKKRELDTTITETSGRIDGIEDHLTNVKNEIDHLTEAKQQLEREIDASINNITEYFERKRKDLKDSLSLKFGQVNKELSDEFKYITDLKEKTTEASNVASYALEYIGPEDFCQVENIISDRLNALSKETMKVSVKTPKLENCTILPVKIAEIDHLLFTNSWLSIIDYTLSIKEEVNKVGPDDTEILVASLAVNESAQNDFAHNPFRILVKNENEEAMNCRCTYDHSTNSFNITSKLVSPGTYSLELYLGDILREKKAFQFLPPTTKGNENAASVSFGQKERIDQLEDNQFLKSEIQCPVCNENFCFEENAFPRILPCLHVVGGNCLNKCITDDHLTCPCCMEVHHIEDGGTEIFPKDHSRKNMAIYWKIKSEGDNIICQNHPGEKATYWCQRCGIFVCSDCSFTHSAKRHEPLVSLQNCPNLESTSISKLQENYYCEMKGHSDKKLELFCISCKAILCLQCYFESHKTHNVQRSIDVYVQLYSGLKHLLEQVSETKANVADLSCRVKDEIKKLKSVSDTETAKMRSTFNNCKESLNERKRELESIMKRACEVKETNLSSQLGDLKKTETTLEKAMNRALDLIEFTNEIPFLTIYKTIEQWLELKTKLPEERNVCEKGLVLYLDTNTSKKGGLEMKNIGNVWSSDISLNKSVFTTNAIVSDEENLLMELHCLDNKEQPVAIRDIKQYLKAELTDSDGVKVNGAVSRLDIIDINTLAIYGHIREIGTYNLMLYIADVAISEKGFPVEVQIPENNGTTEDCSANGLKTVVPQAVRATEAGFLKPNEVIQQQKLKDVNTIAAGDPEESACSKKNEFYSSTTAAATLENTDQHMYAKEDKISVNPTAKAGSRIEYTQDEETVSIAEIYINEDTTELEESRALEEPTRRKSPGLNADGTSIHTYQASESKQTEVFKPTGDFQEESQNKEKIIECLEGVYTETNCEQNDESSSSTTSSASIENINQQTGAKEYKIDNDTTVAGSSTKPAEDKKAANIAEKCINKAVTEVEKSPALEKTMTAIRYIRRAPGAPVGPLNITRTGNTSVRLKWSRPKNWCAAEVKLYQIRRRQNDEDWVQLYTTANRYERNFECCNMSKGTQYMFCVTAINEFGEGPPLVSQRYELKSGGAPRAPVGPLNITRTGNKSVRLKWSTPEDCSAAEVNMYRIKQSQNGDEWQELRTIDEVCVCHYECNIKNAIQYIFCVTAINEFGEGPPLVSERYELKSGDVPSAPVGPVKITTVTESNIFTRVLIQWSPPKRFSDDQINVYRVQVSEGFGSWTDRDTIHASETSSEHYCLSGRYKFRISAVNEYGEGPSLTSHAIYCDSSFQGITYRKILRDGTDADKKQYLGAV